MPATTITQDWLLPDGVADILFADAQKQESLRDALLFVLTAHGYRLVSPPLIEYTETLLENADEQLKRQTFKIIDQLNGRMMGLRADITPQIARIDAQHGKGVSRYCYVGQVVKTLPAGLFGLRTPMQLGAEIFGVDSITAELSLIELLCALFDEIGLDKDKLHIDIGHVAIFEQLCVLHGLKQQDIEYLMKLYAKKALPELNMLCANIAGGADFLVLAKHVWGVASFSGVLQNFSPIARANDVIINACQEIEILVEHIQKIGMSVSVDITELSGYHYHTGLVFNVYLNQASAADTQPLVSGGRFVVGANRQATGFSMDINRLLGFVELEADTVIWVDFDDLQNANQVQKDDLITQIKTLQDEGCVVIKPLSAIDKPTQIDGVLHLDDGVWSVRLVGDE